MSEFDGAPPEMRGNFFPDEGQRFGILTLGVSRMADNPCAVLVCFRRELTDDELRRFHDDIRYWKPKP